MPFKTVLKAKIRSIRDTLSDKIRPPRPPQERMGGLLVGYPANYEEQSARSHSYVSNTSTGYLSIKQETDRVRGNASGQYNPDVTPYQHWLLKMMNVSPFTASFREALWLGSNLLRTVTEDQIWEILADGWEYDPPQAGTEEWDADRIEAFVEAMSKALVVNSAYLTIWSDGSYRVFTTNDVYQPVYMNKHHKQAEIYFLYPSLVGGVAQDSGQQFHPVPIGFLTQFSEEEVRDTRLTGLFERFEGKMANQIFRECVMIQPKPSIHDIFGYSKMQIECDTAVQKVYLRSYEFAFLHKGGVDKTVAVPDKTEKATKDAVVLDAARGLWSRGLVLYSNSNKNPNEQVFVNKTAIPPLFFSEISNLLSEDQQLSKQKVEGQADSGALGGQAPVVNERDDERNQTSLYNILERSIRDVNYVFDGVDSDISEPNEKGRIRRKPAYRVKFKKVITMSTEEYDQMQAAKDNSIQEETEQSDNPNATNPSTQSTSATANSVAMPDMIAHSVSINDDYVVYEGNLFAAGSYYYPELHKYDVFTPAEIKKFTENPINKAPIEISHSRNIKQAGLNNNIGYMEVMGYDGRRRKDITRIHIKKETDTQLRSEGIIVNDTVKLSPYFYSEPDPVTFEKKIFNLNAAIIDPRKEIPRGELTGLKTEAKRVH